MFGNTPVFGYGENAALHTGLVLPGDLKGFRNDHASIALEPLLKQQLLDMDIFNIITGEPVERWKHFPYCMLPCM